MLRLNKNIVCCLILTLAPIVGKLEKSIVSMNEVQAGVSVMPEKELAKYYTMFQYS